MSISISHINACVSDLEESIDFFKLLGFEQEKTGELQGPWIDAALGLRDVSAKYALMSMQGGTTKLKLIQFSNPTAVTDPHITEPNQPGWRHMAFQVTDIEQRVKKLKQHSVTFFSDVQIYEETKKKLVYFHGPDGILLEFAQYEKPTGTGIDHVNVVTSSLPHFSSFFKQLGFQNTHGGELSGPWFSAIVGLEKAEAEYVQMGVEGSQTQLEGIEYIEPVRSRSPHHGKPNQIGLTHMTLNVRSIQEVIKSLGTKSLKSDIQTDPSGSQIVYCRGAGGILLELEQPSL